MSFSGDGKRLAVAIQMGLCRFGILNGSVENSSASLVCYRDFVRITGCVTYQ